MSVSTYFGDYEPTAGDVFACVHARSGSHWMLQIALQITYRGRAEFEHIHDLVVWPDAPGGGQSRRATSEAPTGLRVIKTHLPADYVPYSAAARYICVVRDPKDVFVSGYHFFRSLKGESGMPAVGEWLEQWLSSPYGSPWAKHLASYWKMRHHENVLFLTYEEMSADHVAAVSRVAAFLGVDLAPEELEQVRRQSTFQYMKQIDHKFRPRAANSGGATRGVVIRRGVEGGSDELLTSAQQARIDDFARAALRELGCDFPYDRTFGSAR